LILDDRPERASTCEETSDERLVDDDDPRRGDGVVLGEIAPCFSGIA
jgi:hypothetical protein